ncbi:aliphatic sulfonate ABC transporter substrate-binding protein [Priestia filamentosa]|uniref:aliphatic sulfonate ABC transporter substrate-binding protein n=1 Tax=Priestia filamentosa TaxID=1402861 RepID=UPI00030D2B47|nr:aliphatic sulfonate ABC transporter substrate-binding protein [Priestia filamentosa]
MKKWLLVIAAALLLTACSAKSSAEPGKLKEINIGIQQSLTPLWIAQEKKWFEEAFEKEGIKVKWTEFQSGPPQFEGIAGGKLDVTLVGNSPVIGGQAGGVPFKEIAMTSDGVKGNAILVNKDSNIKSLKDLKGKKIAVAKGSSGFDFLHKALKKAGISPKEVEIIQLQPDEAMPAFQNGSVDAWSIWEPFISLQTIEHDAKILADGETVGTYSPSFAIAREQFIKDHPKELETFMKVYDKTVKWQNAHNEEAVAIYAKTKNLDKKVVANVLKNTKQFNVPISKEIIKDQQNTADFQYEIGAINKEIDVSKVVDNTFVKKVREEDEK